MAKVSIKCATCNSYIVDLHVLYDVIEEVLGSPDCKDPFNVFGRLQDKLEQGYDWWNVEFDWWDAEVAIILDRNCTCNQMFVGKPQEIEDGQAAPEHICYKEGPPSRFPSCHKKRSHHSSYNSPSAVGIF